MSSAACSDVTAVLLSGGLDSAVLLADQAASGDVQPIYVSVGLAWEAAERETIARLLGAAPFARIRRPLVSLSMDVRDVYPSGHWAVAGRAPAYHTPDEDVYLAGRNITLLIKAAVHCAAAHIHRIAIGTLAGNPFPDATPAFREAMAQALSLGLDHRLRIDAPYESLHKADVIRRGTALAVPFEWTLSCMQPVPGLPDDPPRHCGTCSKCRERHDAFLRAGCADPTIYADRQFVRPS